MIPVTKPFLPPKEEYLRYLDEIWQRNWLTNNGPVVSELELKLKEHLQLDHLLFLANGTLALQIAIKALDLKGEIITTPFSYVATTSSIVWEGCKPIFVDIDPDTLNIDPNKIEAAITDQTSAILATHVYGNPCDIEAIEKVAKKHHLKVIYDAAHCFGTLYKGKSVFAYGDISTTSFHATKVFHTIEGGAVFTNDPELLRKMALMRNFGHFGFDRFEGIGINAKNSEFHAAMGLTNLQHVHNILGKRKRDHDQYHTWLQRPQFKFPAILPDSTPNYSYYPIIFSDEQVCLAIFNELASHEIFCRRYFYPLLSGLDYVQAQALPVAQDVSRRVLCLPLHFDMTTAEIDLICRIILRKIKY